MFDRLRGRLSREKKMVGPGVNLLASVLSGAVEGKAHVLTIATENTQIITYLDGDTNRFAVSDPRAGALLAAAVESGVSAALVLRTLNSEPYELQGVEYEGYTVRGWYLWRGHFRPQTEGECFTAFCTDAITGEPVAPELGVTYASGYALNPLTG